MAKTTGDSTSDRAPRKRPARGKSADTPDSKAASSSGNGSGTSDSNSGGSASKTKSRAGSRLKKSPADGEAKKTASPKASSPKARKRPAKKVAETPEAQDIIRQQAMDAAQFALEKKAINVRALDLTKITSMTDYFVICTGESEPQVKAIAENVIAKMRDEKGTAPWRSEGWDALQWVLIDFVDFVVHIFQPESRQYYNLERLWADAPAVTVEDSAAIAPKGRSRKKTAELPSTKTQDESSSGVRVISDFNPVPRKTRGRAKPTTEDDEL
jgi:ribosome-associated protein